MSEMKINKDTISTYYNDPLITKTISNQLITTFPKTIHNIIVLCIGTDRSTGDSLGPMTGTLFSKMNPRHLHVYGTLESPVHALNLETKVNEINQLYNDAFIIAIDASLGKANSVGYFQSGYGSILPGAALKKNLPAVGNAFITGVVNIAGLMEYTVLQSTRLSLVYDMSHTLANVLYHMDLWLQNYKTNQLRNNTPFIKINSQYTI